MQKFSLGGGWAGGRTGGRWERCWCISFPWWKGGGPWCTTSSGSCILVCHPAGSLSGTRLPSRFLFFPFFFVVARLKKEKGEKRTKRNNRGNRGYAHIFLLALVFHLSAIQSPGDPPKMEIILLTSFFANGISFLWRKQHQNYFPVGLLLLLSSDVFFGRTWRARTRRCWTVIRKDKQDAKELLLDLPRVRIKTRADECGLKSAVCVSSGVSVTLHFLHWDALSTAIKVGYKFNLP